MRWTVHSERQHLSLARGQIESTIPDAYLGVTSDERIAQTSLSNSLIDYFAQEKIVPVPEVEKIVLLVGPNAVSILGTPRSPVKTVVTSLLGAQARSLPQGGGGNSSNSSRVTLSISAYKGDHLVDGVPLVRKLAIGLGIIDESMDVSPLSRHLKFGATSGFSDALEVNSAVEADSLCKAMVGSVSFQRVIQYVSLHVRVGLSYWSDHSVDGDDAPHWINKSVVSMWFVSSRHLGEFLERARNSLSQDSTFRFIAGFGRVQNEESAASVADAAALAWHLMVKSGKFTPMSMLGRRRQLGGPDDGGYSIREEEGREEDDFGSASSPKTRSLKESANFAIEKRAALVARATDLMHAREFQSNAAADSENTIAEIKKLQEFLVALGHSHDQAENQFQEAVKKLETERATFRQIEDSLVSASLTTTKLQASVTEQDTLRKELLQDIAALTARKEAALAATGDEENQLNVELQEKENRLNEDEKRLNSQQRELDSELDSLQRQYVDEQEMAQREVNSELDQIKRELQIEREKAAYASEVAIEALQGKQSELSGAKVKLARLETDAKEASHICQQQKTEMSVLTAEYDKAMQNYSTTEGLSQAVRKYREECTSAELERKALERKLEHVRGMVRQVRSNRESQEASLFQNLATVEDQQQALRQEWYRQCRDEVALKEELERLDRLCVGEAEQLARIVKKWGAQHVISQQRMKEHLDRITKRRNDLQDKLLDENNAIHNVKLQNDALDQQIMSTRQEIVLAEKQKDEIEAELRQSLEEIRKEKLRMQENIAGSDDSRFPLLQAQRSDFEERLSLLRSCMVTSSSHTTEKGVSLLVNRRALVDTAETLLERIYLLEQRSRSELDTRQRSLVSLHNKKTHLQEETSLREDLLEKLEDLETEQKQRIRKIRIETNSLQSDLAESVSQHMLTMNDLLVVADTVESSSDKELWDLTRRKRIIHNSLSTSKQAAAKLDTDVSRIQAEINQLRRRRQEEDMQ